MVSHVHDKKVTKTCEDLRGAGNNYAVRIIVSKAQTNNKYSE